MASWLLAGLSWSSVGVGGLDRITNSDDRAKRTREGCTGFTRFTDRFDIMKEETQKRHQQTHSPGIFARWGWVQSSFPCSKRPPSWVKVSVGAPEASFGGLPTAGAPKTPEGCTWHETWCECKTKASCDTAGGARGSTEKGVESTRSRGLSTIEGVSCQR